MSVLDFGEFTDRAAELAAIPLYPVASYMPSAPEQDGFCFLYANRAPFVLGGTIRFTTDAEEIFVRVRLRSAVLGMALTYTPGPETNGNIVAK